MTFCVGWICMLRMYLSATPGSGDGYDACVRVSWPLKDSLNDSSSLPNGGTRSAGKPGGGANCRARKLSPNTNFPSREISACVGDEPGFTSIFEAAVCVSVPLELTLNVT